MTDILVAMFFLGVVVVPAVAALLPMQESEAAAMAINSHEPAHSPVGKAFGAEKATSAASGH